MRKAEILIPVLVLSIVFSIAPLPLFVTEVQAANELGDPIFSIMQISDTQHLAWVSPTLYNDTTSWIVNNSAIYNLKMVIHTGDFIDQTGFSPSQRAIEWANANASMSKLLSAGIPYCWDAGNHDQTPYYNENGTMMGSSYLAFNATYMRSKPYWVSDIFDSKNTAVKFTFNDYPFMVINLENLANSSALAWMKGLLDTNIGVNVIIATHCYLNPQAGYDPPSLPPGVPIPPAVLELVNKTNKWVLALKGMMDGYPNVFLALSGHLAGVNMTRVGDREEILFNRQGASNSTNAASVRVYTFNLASKQVNALTYCVNTRTWLTDAYDQFSFPINLVRRALVGEGRVDVDGVRHQGDTIIFVKMTTIEMVVDGKRCSWVIAEHSIRNNMEAYDGESALGRVKININNGCIVANGPKIHFLSKDT